MRAAILNIPEHRTAGERRQVLRAATRQAERADIYLAAIAAMDLGDRETEWAVRKLRADLESLRRLIADRRARVAD